MRRHVKPSTTQIYTQVSIRRLKAVHSLTHPSAKREDR
jgi:site-specific recombinase XerD